MGMNAPLLLYEEQNRLSGARFKAAKDAWCEAYFGFLQNPNVKPSTEAIHSEDTIISRKGRGKEDDNSGVKEVAAKPAAALQKAVVVLEEEDAEEENGGGVGDDLHDDINNDDADEAIIVDDDDGHEAVNEKTNILNQPTSATLKLPDGEVFHFDPAGLTGGKAKIANQSEPQRRVPVVSPKIPRKEEAPDVHSPPAHASPQSPRSIRAAGFLDDVVESYKATGTPDSSKTSTPRRLSRARYEAVGETTTLTTTFQQALDEAREARGSQPATPRGAALASYSTFQLGLGRMSSESLASASVAEQVVIKSAMLEKRNPSMLENRPVSIEHPSTRLAKIEFLRRTELLTSLGQSSGAPKQHEELLSQLIASSVRKDSEIRRPSFNAAFNRPRRS